MLSRRLSSVISSLLIVSLLPAACTVYPMAYPSGSLEPFQELTPCAPVSCWAGKPADALTYEQTTSLVASLPGFGSVEGSRTWNKDDAAGYVWIASSKAQVALATHDGAFASLVRWFEPVALEQVIGHVGQPSHIYVYPSFYPYPNSKVIWFTYESTGVIVFSEPVSAPTGQVQISPSLGIRGYGLGSRPDLRQLLHDLALHVWVVSRYTDDAPSAFAANMVSDAQPWVGYDLYTVTSRPTQEYFLLRPAQDR